MLHLLPINILIVTKTMLNRVAIQKQGKKDLLLNIRVEQFTMGSGLEIREMVKGHKHGMMEQNLLVHGRIIWPMGRESFFMLMEMFSREPGLKIRHVDLVFTHMRMVPNTKVNG